MSGGVVLDWFCLALIWAAHGGGLGLSKEVAGSPTTGLGAVGGGAAGLGKNLTGFGASFTEPGVAAEEGGP